MKLTLIRVAILSLSLSFCVQGALAQSDKKMDRFIDKLMSKMTLEEKIGQLNLPVTGEIVTGEVKSSNIAEKLKAGEVGGLFNLKGVERIYEVQRQAVEGSRLGIPLLFGMDVIHGYETVFPIPLALAATWNMDAVERSARIAAIEASADGICWTFSPMIDISRDPRWGRVSEGAGEDPYLGAEYARAMVIGYQGNNYSSNSEIMACFKHFALYGASEAGRDYNTVDMSRIRMFNDYMPPYKAAVEAGVGSAMASFNEIDGVPATGNKWLLTDILRDDWGFDGFVVSDFTGIMEMVDHGVGDTLDVTTLAINAGLDMDMVSDFYVNNLKKLYEEGRISIDVIDRACRRMLEAKYKLGLFDDPYKYCDVTRPAKDVFTPEHRAEAREIAAESFVLLRNEGELLPIAKSGTIGVIGPLADTKSNMPGTWSVAAVLDNAVSLTDGLKEIVGQSATILTAKGCNLVSDAALESRVTMFGRGLGRDSRTDEELIAEALEVAAKSDVIVAALGESSEFTGESSSRTDLDLPCTQRRLLEALLATGKPVVMVLFTGRPLSISWESENVDAILNVWFAGSEAGYAIGDVLFGDKNPSGKLPMTFPQNVGQVPIYYAHKNTGRPLADGAWFQKFRSNYLDVTNEPLYAFGYGLSYTTFDYSDVTLSSESMTEKSTIKASVTVTNSGKYDGAEVVQLYIADKVGSITRPVKELKGFEKIYLKAGESKVVEFTIDADMLKFYDANIEFVCEKGDFDAMIGGSSDNVKISRFTLK